MIWAMTASILLAIVLIGLVILNAVGVLMVVFQLPGTWMMLSFTGLVAWWRWDDVGGWGHFGWWTLGILVLLAVIGEILEFAAGAVGASKAGASKRAAVIAIVGGIVGALVGTVLIPIPILGTLVGAAIGSGVGSFLGDLWAGRTVELAWEGGKGAVWGKFWGAVLKVVIAVVMWFVVVIAIFI